MGAWQSVVPMLVGNTLMGAVVQFVVMLIVTLVTIHSILRMRREDVVVLDGGQLFVSTLVATVICTLTYQVLLWIGPANRWGKGVALASVFAVTIITRMVTMGVVGAVDGGRSIRDTTNGEGALFNCNWPLISRCANHSLLLMCIAYLATAQVWGK